MRAWKPKLILLFKLLVVIAAFAWVLHKADISVIWGHIKAMPPLALIATFIMLNISQIVSALRARYYFSTLNIHFSRAFAVAYYYLGMFYSTVLPGGISGDGYKIYKISKLSGCRKRDALRLTLSERASGLLALSLIFLIFLALSESIHKAAPYETAILVTLVGGLVIGYRLVTKWLLAEPLRSNFGALLYSLIVQGAYALGAWILFNGMEQGSLMDYMALALFANIIAVAPISIGGAGLREVTFLYGAPLLGLNQEAGVAFALLYFALHTLCSLEGIVFLHGALDKLYRKN